MLLKQLKFTTSKTFPPELRSFALTLNFHTRKERKEEKRGRKPGKMAVSTATPYKNELEAASVAKLAKETPKSNMFKAKQTTTTVYNSKKVAKKLRPRKKKDKKESDYSSSTSNDEDNDAAQEGWILCRLCKRWAHDSCAGAEPDDDDYTCDFCL